MKERVKIFLERMKGQRSIGGDDIKELVAIWMQLTGEKVWCTTCGAVIGDLYKKVKEWYDKQPEIEHEDALLEDYDLVKTETSSSYTPKKSNKKDGKSRKKSS